MKERWRITRLEAGAVIVLLIVAGLLLGAGSDAAAVGQRYRNADEIAKILPDLAVAADNIETSPISISSATAKEVTGEEYEKLTGMKPLYDKYVCGPSLKIVNSSGRKIKAVMLGLLDHRSNRLNVLRINGDSLKSGKEFSVDPSDWVRGKAGKKFTLNDDGVAKEDTSLPSWSSEEMWLPGSITDFSVFVGKVEFADGGMWTTTRS
jgi:hypothetical protein